MAISNIKLINWQSIINKICFSYGSRVPTENCGIAVVVMSIQSIVGVVIQVGIQNINVFPFSSSPMCWTDWQAWKYTSSLGYLYSLWIQPLFINLFCFYKNFLKKISYILTNKSLFLMNVRVKHFLIRMIWS